ncbi:hypothetical protein FRB99_002030 [Tulasnella sp. 403]|nr:hypothetical protein FRB99_002030 [Tulasnella sp. 403]
MSSLNQFKPLVDFLTDLPRALASLTPWQDAGVAAGVIALIPVLKLTKSFIRWYLSPLKDLRGPETANSWLWGHMAKIQASPGGIIFDEWTAKYGTTIQFRALLQTRRLLTIDPRAIAYIVNHTGDYPRPYDFRQGLARIVGHGLLSVGGDDHRRQRRIMNPCFGPAQIRGLMPIFYEKAYRLKSVWLDAVEESGSVIDILVGMNRATLDIIGSAGFSYEFDSLLFGEKNELIRSFMDIFDPANRDKLRAELRAVDNERPSMDELNALPYLDAVIRETLRLNAVVESTTRVAEKDDVIPVSEPFVDHHGVVRNEIRIGKGETVLIPIMTLNRHPSIWGEDGGEFKPERWLTANKGTNELPSVFAGLMTFLGGPHGCIGYRFAVMEMKVLTFVLLRCFAFELSDPTLVFEKKPGIVTRPVLKQPDGSYKNSMVLRLTPVD